MSTRSLGRPARPQRGAASLIVVSLLFFIVALVAAYTNRNLVFEQRTAANQYRSSQAMEAAEAGVEWALSMLNIGRIDAACLPSATVTDTSFRQRYLQIDPDTGMVTPLGPLTPAPENASTVWASCVQTGAGWDCDCPSAGSPSLTPPVGTEVHPAFRVRFVTVPTKPGVVRLQVNGCTRLDDACLDFPAQAVAGDSRVTVTALLALRGALAAPPVAAITVRNALNANNQPLGAFNADSRTAGLALLTGGALTNGGNVRTAGSPGTPPDLARSVNDATFLAELPSSRRLFTSTFAMEADTYLKQPATLALTCSPCNADDLRNALARNPGRMVWVNADLDLDTGIVGSAAEPAMIVVTGALTLDAEVHGVVFGATDNFAVSGSGQLYGALIAQQDMNSTATFDVVYDPDVLARLRWQTGSFVRVPGGWSDF
jgi:hypothetical protein